LLKLKAELAQGQVYAARGDCDEAVRLFFKVAYGRGGKQAPAAFHSWQAEAIFAAARTLESTDRPGAAQKLYQELVTDYPSSSRVALAQESLDDTIHR
jgi:TolA-binding protein